MPIGPTLFPFLLPSFFTFSSFCMAEASGSSCVLFFFSFFFLSSFMLLLLGRAWCGAYSSSARPLLRWPFLFVREILVGRELRSAFLLDIRECWSAQLGVSFSSSFRWWEGEVERVARWGWFFESQRGFLSWAIFLDEEDRYQVLFFSVGCSPCCCVVREWRSCWKRLLSSGTLRERVCKIAMKMIFEWEIEHVRWGVFLFVFVFLLWSLVFCWWGSVVVDVDKEMRLINGRDVIG